MRQFGTKLATAGVLFVMCAAAPAMAQSDTPTIHINMDGGTVSGEVLRPTGVAVQARQGATFDSLIEIRRDFLVEITESAGAVALR